VSIGICEVLGLCDVSVIVAKVLLAYVALAKSINVLQPNCALQGLSVSISQGVEGASLSAANEAEERRRRKDIVSLC
jgi:hypothetical protein